MDRTPGIPGSDKKVTNNKINEKNGRPGEDGTCVAPGVSARGHNISISISMNDGHTQSILTYSE